MTRPGRRDKPGRASKPPSATPAGAPSLASPLAARLQGLADRHRLVALLAVNLFPVICVLLFHWDVTQLMLLYWAENVVIGVYVVAKMVASGFAHRPMGLFSAAFWIPLFVVHYGLFCLGHGFLILVFGAMAQQDGGPIPFSALEQLMRAQAGFRASLAAMVLFHGMNFAFGWLPGGGARATTPSDLSFTPYGRIGVLHLALMGAMGLVLLLHEPVAAVVMLGLCKTGLELGQRKRFDGADDCGAPNDP